MTVLEAAQEAQRSYSCKISRWDSSPIKGRILSSREMESDSSSGDEAIHGDHPHGPVVGFPWRRAGQLGLRSLVRVPDKSGIRSSKPDLLLASRTMPWTAAGALYIVILLHAARVIAE